METYIRFIVKRKRLVLILFLFVTVASLYIISTGTVASSISEFLADQNKYNEYLSRTKDFNNDEVIIVAFQDNNILSKNSHDKLKKAVENINALDQIKRVVSLLDAVSLEVKDGAINMDNYFDQSLENPEQTGEILNKLQTDPLLSGLLISNDGQHTAVLIQIDPEKVTTADMYPLVVEDVLLAFEKAGYKREDLHRTGIIPVIAEVIHVSKINLLYLFPVVAVVLLIAAYLMFRRLWPVAITGMVAFMAVIWTMAFTVIFFDSITVLVAMVPGFVMIIAFSDVVHLCSSYLIELQRNEEKEEAILKSCTEVGRACLFTSLTTFSGFVSIALVPVQVSRQMGLTLGFGVGAALFLAMTLSPALFALMRKPKEWRSEDSSQVQDLLDKVLIGINSLTAKRPKIVIAAFLILGILSIAGALQFEMEADFVNRFDEDHKLRKDEQYFTDNFAGTNCIDIFIDSPEKDGLIAPDTFKKISELKKNLENFPEIDKVVSIIDPIMTFHTGLRPDEDWPPDEKNIISQYLFLMEEEADFEQFMNFDRNSMRLIAHIEEDGFVATNLAGVKIKAAADALKKDGLDVEVTGLGYLLGKDFDKIIGEQKRALGLAFLVIMIMMVLATRSVYGGVWSMVPNLIPLLVICGYVGWFWDKVDTDVIMVLIVAIGIGVDDTIHFLTRLRIELTHDPDIQKAVDNTFHYSGRAIIMTSVILVAGFSPMAISNYFTIHIMGTLIPACLVVALLADLVLVPAMVQVGLFRFGIKKK